MKKSNEKKSEKQGESESYLVFARKFRPQTFEDVIGQEPITTTLQNSIERKRIAQSFLFTGSRGVGKTSTARILAKALNCEKGPTAKPCNKCSVCDEITRGISLDILEIDGASNRGIEEIRTLRENVKFKPTQGRYKVYIIDEVHMLTGEAFNALLKTLEEPPEHVKFIFATTEVHKVPLTILSRCQRFNFRRIPIDTIASKLKEIARDEKIKITSDALFLVAKQADGSLRDAESLLDQLACFSEGEIKETDIAFSLGLTESEIYFSILKCLKEKDSKSVLVTIAQVTEQGKDLIQFSKGLLELFRNLMVLNISAKNDNLIEVSEDELKRLKEFAQMFSREELLFSVTLIQQLVREIRWVDTPRFLIESCLLKIANRADLKAIDDVLKEIKTLKGNLPAEFTPQIKTSQVRAEVRTEVNFTKPAEKQIAPVVMNIAKNQASALRDSKNVSPDSSITLNEIGRVWPELLERIKGIKMSCGTYLSESEPLEVTDGLAVFGLPIEFKFHRDALDKQDNKELVRSTLSTLLGKEVGVSFVVTTATKEVATKKLEPPPVSSKEQDIIHSALNIFESGKVIRRDPA